MPQRSYYRDFTRRHGSIESIEMHEITFWRGKNMSRNFVCGGTLKKINPFIRNTLLCLYSLLGCSTPTSRYIPR